MDSGEKKTFPLTIRLDQSVADDLAALALRHKITKSELHRRILAAGVQAIKENGGEWNQPMKMKMVGGSPKKRWWSLG